MNRLIIRKGIICLCSLVLLLSFVFSGCGTKAPPKPPTREPVDQSVKQP